MGGKMRTLILSAILAVTLSAKDRNWETGKVLDVHQERFYNHGMNAQPDVAEYFLIQGAEYTYLVEQPLIFVWNTPIQLTVNSTVKFVIEKGGSLGRKIRLVDDFGKEHERGIYLLKRVKNPD
jgi:hypothetical protein